MAYLIGLVTADEAAELKALGWELEDPQAVIEEAQDTVGDLHERQQASPPQDLDKCVVGVYVDSNLFKIMTGPDWEKRRS